MPQQSLTEFLHRLPEVKRIEAVAVLALYARDHEGQPEINETLVRALWPRAGRRLPRSGNIAQSLRDAKNKRPYGYLARGAGPGWFRLTPEGEGHAKQLLEGGASLANQDARISWHPVIADRVGEYLRGGHTGVAVLEAFKAVNNFVKDKCGRPREGGKELDGKDLMSKAFRPDCGFLMLNKGKTQSDHAEQEGFMFLFMGALEGIRNPRGHERLRNIPRDEAAEYLAFASLLVRRAERARKRPIRGSR